MEVQLINTLIDTFPNVAVSIVVFYFVYRINTNILSMQNNLSNMDKELEYVKVKLRILQESLDKIKEDSIRTTVEASTLKERLDRAGINGHH